MQKLQLATSIVLTGNLLPFIVLYRFLRVAFVCRFLFVLYEKKTHESRAIKSNPSADALLSTFTESFLSAMLIYCAASMDSM